MSELEWYQFKRKKYEQLVKELKNQNNKNKQVGNFPTSFLFSRSCLGDTSGIQCFCAIPTIFTAKLCTFYLLHLSRNCGIIIIEKHKRCALVAEIPPSVPLHPFEPGSPFCGLCLRLGRQRDDVRSSRTADKNFFKKFQKKS